MARCPNKSHSDYKLMVRLFGEDAALFYYDSLGDIPTTDVIAGIYELEKGVALTDTNNPEVWDIEDSEDLIGKWRTDKQGKKQPVRRSFNPYKAKALAKQLREKYPQASISTVKFETASISNSKIKVSVPLDTAPKSPFKSLPGYEQRQLEGIPQRELLTTSERQDFERKKEIMLKTFPWVKEVIEDDNLINLGQLEEGGTVIRVNPIKMAKDTLGHEFGHLLIDLIGGLENPLVKAALKQLEGTPLAKRIRTAYADKTETVILKEILAEAIGLDTAKLYADEQARNKWERWLVRFFERAKRFLGIEKGAVRKLSRMVLGSEEFDAIASVAEDIYEQKPGKDKLKEEVVFDKSVETIRLLRLEVIDKLTAKVAIYERQGEEIEISAIKDQIEEIEAEEKDEIALYMFAKHANIETKKIYKEYEDALKRVKAGNTRAVNAKELLRWSDYVSAYNIITDIEQAIIKRVGREKYEDDPLFAPIRKDIQDTKTRRDAIQGFLTKEGIDIVAKWLEPHTTRITAEYKLIYEKKWRSMNKDTRPPKDEYLNEQAFNDKDDIEDNTRTRIRAELNKGTFDIGYAYRLAENVLDSDDMVIASMAKAFAATMDKARHATIEKRNDLVDTLKKLEDFNPQSAFKTSEAFYDFMIEKDDKGNYSNKMVGKFKSSFWKAYDIKKAETQETLDIAIENIRKSGGTSSFKADAVRSQQKAAGVANRSWLGAQAPVQVMEMEKSKIAFIEKMYKDGELTLDEKITAIDSTQDNTPKPMSLVLLDNHQAAVTIERWSKENEWAFREPVEKWKSKQFEELNRLRAKNADDPRVKFYDLIQDMIIEGEKSLPYRYRLHQSLPFIPKSTTDRLVASNGLYTTIKAKAKESFVNQVFDTERGQLDERGQSLELMDENNNPKMFLPVFYTPKVVKKTKLVDGKEVDKTEKEIAKEEKEILDLQSFDISSIYYNWYKMAMEYKHKSDVISEMELAKYLVEQREVTRLDSNKNPILNANERLRQRHLTKSGLQSNLAHQLDDWFTMVVYGKTIKDEGFIKIGNAEISRSKIADNLNKYTAFNLLGLNMMQGVANKALGEVMQIVDMFSGEHYGMKEYSKATVQYNRNMFGIMGDIGQRRPTNIISLLLEHFDVLHDYSDPVNFQKSTVFSQMMTTNSLFFMAKAGEHSMQAKVMLAILNRMNAKDKDGKTLKDESGKDMSMFDAFKVVKGKLTVDPRVAMTATQIDVVGHTMKRLLSRMHGEYSDLGRVALQRYALGRMVYMFRKFMMQGFKRRWELGSRRNDDGSRALKYNEVGEFFTEGSYISTGRFLGSLAKDILKFHGNVAKAYAETNGNLNSVEIANLRRTMAEIIMFALISYVGKIAISLKEDDDDDNLFLSHMTYQALRLKSEMAFFLNPLEAMKILRSPAAAMSVLENTGKLLSSLYPTHFRTQFERGPWKGHYKWHKYGINMFPVIRQGPRLLDVDNQINWFK